MFPRYFGKSPPWAFRIPKGNKSIISFGIIFVKFKLTPTSGFFFN